MKNLLVLILLINIISCSQYYQIDHIPKKEIVNILDLTKYSAKGFLITPEELNGEYESVGSLYCKILPEAKRHSDSSGYQPSREERMRGITGVTTNIPTKNNSKWKISHVTIDQAIDTAYNKALALGGDAIMEFKVNTILETISVSQYENITLYGYEITGFVIKRK